MLKIFSCSTNLLQSNMYIMIENRNAIIIDPYFDKEVCKIISDNADAVDCILLTHEHYDHISGTNEIHEQFNAPVFCSAKCAARIEKPKDNLSKYFEAYWQLQTEEPIPPELELTEYSCHANDCFSDETSFSWNGHNIRLIETPGHSPGSICIIVDEQVLFSGDLLLEIGQRITNAPGGSKKELVKRTLPFLKTLSPDITVYPGHYGCFKLGEHLFMSEDFDI